MRTQIAAANWKMNCTLQQAEDLLNKLSAVTDFNTSNKIAVIAVPAPYLLLAKQKLAHQSNMFVAAQNCYIKNYGAYTGEISAEMLQSMGISYVLIGHSERREYFNENNAMLAEKINIAFNKGIECILKTQYKHPVVYTAFSIYIRCLY